MALKFGTSGVRGLVDDLTDLEVYLFTTAFLSYTEDLKQNLPVCIGKDLRDSSDRIQMASAQAIYDFGRKVYFCGDISTPALALFAQNKKALAVMITGSHIPADRNGIKFYLQQGETLKYDEEKIYREYEKLKEQRHGSHFFDSQGFFKDTDTNLLSSSKNPSDEALDLYQKRYLSLFSNNLLAAKKIIFYQHSSVAREVFPKILEKLGAEVIRIGKSKQFIPVDTEAVESVGQFQKWILEFEADAMVSTDGDADRPLLIDEKGQVIPGDKIGIITAQFLNCDAVATPISSNSGISEIPSFKEVNYTKIGSPFVIESLQAMENYYKQVCGFEANGGFLLASDVFLENGVLLKKLPTRDSVLPVLCTLAQSVKSELSLSGLVQTLPQRYTSNALVKNCPVEKSAGLLREIARSPEAFLIQHLPQLDFKLEKINQLDGFRMTSSINEVIHLRPSGNAPEFRCYTEASTQEKADFLSREVLAKLRDIFKSV